MDFFGLPDKSELLVVMDEFSRFPVVAQVKTTASEYVIPQLDMIFSLLGIPSVLKTDNGPPFNGIKFKEYSQYMVFKHRKITPLAPSANGQAEVFMKSLGKLVRSAVNEGKSWQDELNKFLRNYRSTPHGTTGQPPSVLMFNRNNACRLPKLQNFIDQYDLAEVQKKDRLGKAKSKAYTDKRRKAKEVIFKAGDEVVCKQERNTKWKTIFGREIFYVTEVKGSMVTVKSKETDRIFTRDRSWFKKKSWESTNDSTEDDTVTIATEFGLASLEVDPVIASPVPVPVPVPTTTHFEFIESESSNSDLSIRNRPVRNRLQTQRYQPGQSGMEPSLFK